MKTKNIQILLLYLMRFHKVIVKKIKKILADVQLLTNLGQEYMHGQNIFQITMLTLDGSNR